MEKLVATLKAARAVIALEDNWTQVYLAKASKAAWDTVELKPDDVSATCFCAFGALCKVLGVADPMKGSEHLLDAAIELGWTVGMPIAMFNDTRPHKEVLAAFDETIERLSAKKG